MAFPESSPRTAQLRLGDLTFQSSHRLLLRPNPRLSKGQDFGPYLKGVLSTDHQQCPRIDPGPLSAFLLQDGPPALVPKTLFFFFLRISVRIKCHNVCKSPADLWYLPDGKLSIIDGLFVFIMSSTLKYIFP